MLDTEFFINGIKYRPELWNLKSKDYANRDVKDKSWLEVAALVVSKWVHLNDTDKNKESKLKLFNLYSH